MCIMPILKRSSDIFMKEIHKQIRLAIKILKTLVKDSFQYPHRLVIDTFTVIARCGILLLLYWYVFKLNNGVINGTTFIFSAWSIFFYFSFSTLRLQEISKWMNHNHHSSARNQKLAVTTFAHADQGKSTNNATGN